MSRAARGVRLQELEHLLVGAAQGAAAYPRVPVPFSASSAYTHRSLLQA